MPDVNVLISPPHPQFEGIPRFMMLGRDEERDEIENERALCEETRDLMLMNWGFCSIRLGFFSLDKTTTFSD